jgi:uncharacterized BrkB/YihY/UPF0761 family membrane protein
VGTTLSVVLWLVFTVGLGAYFRYDKTLGETYGPLLGIIGLLLWAYRTAVALFLGLAFAAQLEAVRAGVPGPRVSHGVNLPEPHVPSLREAGQAEDAPAVTVDRRG